ncbi:hypothetical protein TRIP_C60275 [Candidatus Zixiibacteriota bacterium]|nr:hypothetical protein TRIP_C60275 [candidate division Zixibacteria bacterium]
MVPQTNISPELLTATAAGDSSEDPPK